MKPCFLCDGDCSRGSTLHTDGGVTVNGFKFPPGEHWVCWDCGADWETMVKRLWATQRPIAPIGSKDMAQYHCFYCGEAAPYGDERFPWLRWHTSRLHRLWQWLRL